MAVINGDYSLTQPSLVNDVSNQPSKVKSVNTPTKVADRIPIFASIVKEIGEKHFASTICQIPNWQFYILMTIAEESSWNIIFSDTRTSRGHVNNINLEKAFYSEAIIANYLRAHPYEAEAKMAIQDGTYAHSLGQTLGMYHMAGTAGNKEMFSRKRDIVNEYGLEVPVGTRVTSLFPDNMTGAYRAIAGCLIVYESKYKNALTNPNPSIINVAKGDKSSAAKLALGKYCGSLIKPDALGNTGNARISAIMSGQGRSGVFTNQLAKIGIRSDVTTFTPVDLANASLRTTKTMGSVGNTGQTTASTTTPPNNYAGCG